MRPAIIGAIFILLTALFVAVQSLLAFSRLPGRKAVSLRYGRMLCALLRVRVGVVGAPLRGQPLLLVGNHVSWLDIPVIASVLPVAFVAKSEIANWPLVGTVARVQGTIFVDRARRQQTAQTNAEIAGRLIAGDAVMLFAEGTSSDGNRVLRFRSALVGAVEAALQPGQSSQLFLQPLSVCYTRLDGLPLGRQHRPRVAWYGDLDFVPHFRDFLASGAIDAVLSFGEPIPYAGDADRKQLVEAIERSVRSLTSTTLRQSPPAVPACAPQHSFLP